MNLAKPHPERSGVGNQVPQHSDLACGLASDCNGEVDGNNTPVALFARSILWQRVEKLTAKLKEAGVLTE